MQRTRFWKTTTITRNFHCPISKFKEITQWSMPFRCLQPITLRHHVKDGGDWPSHNQPVKLKIQPADTGGLILPSDQHWKPLKMQEQNKTCLNQVSYGLFIRTTPPKLPERSCFQRQLIAHERCIKQSIFDLAVSISTVLSSPTGALHWFAT